MDLRLKLDDTNFEELVESARAMIPALAREWTDHNIHDPGIMLIELMAWLAEAQIYSLARTRIDERIAYANLLGIEQRGPAAARGLIWPLEADEPGYQPDSLVGQSIDKWTVVEADQPEMPPFRLSTSQHMTAAVLKRVVTYLSDGQIADNTRINRRNGATYLPFGTSPSTGDRLVLSFDGYAIASGGSGAFALGVEVSDSNAVSSEPGSNFASVLVSIRDATGERPLMVVNDTTSGFSRSGVVLIAISENEQKREPQEKDGWFELILRPRAKGFIHPPRVRRIAANVLFVEQIESIVEEESNFGWGAPGQGYKLKRSGRLTHQDLLVEIAGKSWTRVEDLSQSDPDDLHYQLDEANHQLLFGNGINGHMPPADALLRVAYDVCGGAIGNAPAGLGWSIRGVSGIFGRNSRPCSGASDAMQLADLQVRARASLSERVTYVTPGDLERAALTFDDLRVHRARELPPIPSQIVGTRVLLAVAQSDPAQDESHALENALWLDAIRSRLAPGLLAGQRLEVVAPRYVHLRIAAKLLIPASADPEKVRHDVRLLLRSRFVDVESGNPIWKLGRDVTPMMVSGWLRNVDDVLDLSDMKLYRNGVAQSDKVIIGPIEIPRLEMIDGDIVIERMPVSEAP